MTTSAEILADGFERVRQTSRAAGRGLSQELLETRLDPESNTIAWLLWHLARGQDAQVADAMGEEQVWTAEGWSGRFGLALPDSSTGYAHSADDVAKVSGVSGELLAERMRDFGHRSVVYSGDIDRAIDDVVNNVGEDDAVLTLGAGNVWQAGERLLERLRK